MYAVKNSKVLISCEIPYIWLIFTRRNTPLEIKKWLFLIWVHFKCCNLIVSDLCLCECAWNLFVVTSYPMKFQISYRFKLLLGRHSNSCNIVQLKAWNIKYFHPGSKANVKNGCTATVVRASPKLIDTAKRNMSSAMCASSMYSCLSMKMSYFLIVHAWAMSRTFYLSCGIPFPA